MTFTCESCGHEQPYLTPVVRSGEAVIDLQKREIRQFDIRVHVPPKEWTLIVLLSSTPDEVVSWTRIVDALWGGIPDAAYLNCAKVYASRLRVRTGLNIETLPKVGLRLIAA